MTPYIAAAGIGMLGSSLFDNNDTDYGYAYDDAEKKYEDEMAKAEQALQSHESQGRSQLLRALGGSSLYSKPYRQAGKSSLSALLGSLGLGGDTAHQSAIQSFQSSPGYQFSLQQGLQGVSRGMSTGGLRDSGAEQKELTQYATGLADQEYNKWQNQLMGLAGMGQKSSESSADRMYGAGSQLAGLSQQYGQDYAQMYGKIAQSMAESELAKTQYEAQRSAQQGSSMMGNISSIGQLASLGGLF